MVVGSGSRLVGLEVDVATRIRQSPEKRKPTLDELCASRDFPRTRVMQAVEPEWVKIADENKAAEVLYYANNNWSRVVRKGQVQQWQSEAKQMAAAIKIAEAVKGWGVINPWAVTPWYGIQHHRWGSVVWSLCELMYI